MKKRRFINLILKKRKAENMKEKINEKNTTKKDLKEQAENIFYVIFNSLENDYFENDFYDSEEFLNAYYKIKYKIKEKIEKFDDLEI